LKETLKYIDEMTQNAEKGGKLTVWGEDRVSPEKATSEYAAAAFL